MTAVEAPPGYLSGFCGVAAHERCRGTYAGCDCTCPCHTTPPPEPEPAPVPERPPGPYLRLSWAALALDGGQRLPEKARRALAEIFRSEAAWAADRGDTYPDDRAPLLHLADLILGGVA